MLILTLIKGIVVGIVIALPVGPVGVLCVRRTIFEGLPFGLVSGLGAACADAMFGVIAGFGLTALRDTILEYQDWLGAAGGVFLVFSGTRAIFGAAAIEPEPLAGERLMGSFASAFALTISNPITILMFAAIFAKVGLTDDATYVTVAIMVAAFSAGSAAWWLGITSGIAWLRRHARSVTFGWLNRVSGAILLVSGVALVIAAALGLAGVSL